MIFRLRMLAFCAVMPVLFVVTPASAQRKPPTKAVPATAAPAAQQPKQADPKPGQPKPYKEVVTAEAVSQDGLFKVHQIDEKVLFEVPASALGRDLLWQSSYAAVSPNSDLAGNTVAQSVVRFTRRGNRLYLRQPNFTLRSLEEGGNRVAVEDSTLEPIIAVYPILAEGKDKSAVIDVSALFLGNPQTFGRNASGMAGAFGADTNRSYLERIKAFPTNIEATATETLMSPRGGNTAQVHYSIVALPEKPMMGRYSDSRIGFFAQDFSNVGGPKNRITHKGFITRFRLEKKNPEQEISEPVKPIVWYVGRGVPDRWKPWVKKGIEDWNAAFEQAGFKNAIVAKQAPTEKEDPDWNSEDARFSVVRWAPSETENAFGGPSVDPRSGETIHGQVMMFNDVMKLAEGWYFSQCAAIDPRARHLPFSDELEGELVRYVVAHEIGHALGLYHNWVASSAYTIAQLRDPKFTSEFGVSPSIMDYSRFNYVAQPGDGVTQTIGKVGPYDKFAIEWGYKPIPSAQTADEENTTLDKWLARQIEDPRLRYWPEGDPIDPAAQNEDIGDDAIAASTLGLKNIDEIASKYLVSGTTRFGEDYSDLKEMRGRLLMQRFLEIGHVVKNIGGVVGHDYHSGRGGDVYAPVPAAKQAAAVKWVLNYGLSTPKALFAPELVNKLQPTGLIDGVTSLQKLTLDRLFQEARLKRMLDNEAVNGAKSYTVERLIGDVTGGVYAELADPTPHVDPYRRTLQRAFLKSVDGRINGATASQTDFKPLMKAELKSLAGRIDKALVRTKDRMTFLHLSETRKDVEKILDNKYATPSGGGGFSIFDLFGIKESAVKGCLSPDFGLGD